MTISMIVAMSNNLVIGKNGKLPWHLPEDLRRFRKLTTGNTVIMGRKTFESIGRELPSRKNIIISRNNNYNANSVTTLNEAILKSEKDVFIIGGLEIYKLAVDVIDIIYLTIIDINVNGDVRFDIELNGWFISGIDIVYNDINRKNLTLERR